MRVAITAILLLFCCRSEDKELATVYRVPEEMEGFVSSFREEGADRGVELNITNLIIEYDSTMTGPFCGVCNSNSPDPAVQKIITVNPFLQCWYSYLEQEALFFHELGHCVLGRVHDNSLLPNGDPKSMMVESDPGVYAPCVYDVGDPCNNTFKRSYYLDELFNENTAVPEWAK